MTALKPKSDQLIRLNIRDIVFNNGIQRLALASIYKIGQGWERKHVLH